MISKKRLLWVNALVIIPMLLTACGPAATPPPPTVDVNALFTQAAVTMVAQLTANAPTLTPTLAATDTPVPTMTPLGGVLPTLPPLATLPPLFTPTASTGVNTADKAAFVTQSPADYETVTTGKVFNIIWRLRNVGTTTWNPNYVYRFYAAANKISTAANGYNLTANVPPNGEVDLKVTATAPGTPGTYDTQWVLTNPEGVNFALFTLTLNVVQGSGGGGTVATATGVPNNCEIVVQDGNPKSFSGANSWTVNGNQVLIYISKDTKPGVEFTVTIDGQIPEQGGSFNTYSSVSPLRLSYHAPGDPAADKSPHVVVVTASGTMTVLKVSSISSNTFCF